MMKEKLYDSIEYLYRHQDYENLIKRCDMLLEIESDNPVALNYKAIALYYLESYDESLKLLEYNLNMHPHNPYVLNNMALVHIALGNYRKALDCCEEGLKYKDFDWLQINKIESLIYLGRSDDAYEFFKSVNIPYYTFEEALANCGEIESDGLFERLNELLDEGKYGEVLEICDMHESTERLLDYRIISLVMLEREDEALACVDGAIEEYPHNYDFLFFKTKISRNLDDVIGCYEKAFEILGSASNHRLEVNRYIGCLDIRAHRLIEAAEYGEAIRTCEKILKYCPETLSVQG